MLMKALNDRGCLSKLHQKVEWLTEQPAVIEFANEFETTDEIAAFIRSRPLQLDHGDPADGPRIDCIPSQRLRVMPDTYNCFEATGYYLAFAEIIDPSTPRTSCTIRVQNGYHTFPVENGEPVILDPDSPPRNAMHAGVYQCERRNGLRPGIVESGDAHRWVISVARNAAHTPCERRTVRNAVDSLNRAVIHGEPLADLQAVAETLALAESEAGLWGDEGREATRHVARSLRNLQIRTDLGGIMGLAQRLGGKALEAYVLSQTGPMGLAVLQSLKPSRTPEHTARTNRASRAPERPARPRVVRRRQLETRADDRKTIFTMKLH